MRVTEKGQVTIPKAIRDRLGIKSGSEVEFIESRSGVRLERKLQDGKAVEQGFRQWVERFRGAGQTGLSVDEYMIRIREQEIPLPPKPLTGATCEDTD